MKNIKHLTMLFALCLVSQMVWSSPGFESSNPAMIMQFIQGHSAIVYLAAFFGLGILLAFTPCVLPMVPILSGIIVGQQSLSPDKAFKLSLSYVLGMAITYAVAGMLTGLMGSTIQTIMQTPSVIIGFSLVFVLMALSMFGLFELRLPARLNTRLNALSQSGSRQNYISVALMGVISTLVVSPCVTAPLIGVLTYIGQQGEVMMGGLILFVMALGMGIPLLLVGSGYGSILPKTGAWMLKIKQLFGFMMLAIAIWMLSRVFPHGLTNLLWAALLIISSISMGSLKTQTGKPAKFFQIMGVCIMMAGGVIAYNTVTASFEVSAEKPVTAFTLVHSEAELQEKLNMARKEHKKVFVEFFAGWCSDCQAMDKTVFNQPEIQQAMNKLVNVRVDISEKTEEVNRIKKHYGIYGIPTLMFFDGQGNPLSQLQAAGFVSKNEMLRLLKAVNEIS
ncbi:protein-disulfide reductase DsbD [Legionella israelensis]|uniref:Thiol:disulfide interchange protein DsbD n=1 Tax=Legionella israelensis TaxID=454 RepID=A0A0W0W386_9GAMM|nr:protein-disulfide reductase DsbD [Legionella israelensis]KTD26932.1 thiol:disulfide interchange protein DsbD [Legionella israelensis]SCX75645.1 thiol:disulfide interchange protein DsbD [Legionella israelensis DSM 19235]STX58251.1 thiol:disulfide interchange protein DsbD [Legionella israelensis]